MSIEEIEASAVEAKERKFIIIVNASPKIVEGRDLSFLEVVQLEFPNATLGGNIIYTVTYKKGPPANRQGSMGVGDTVKVKIGMVFNVSATDKS